MADKIKLTPGELLTQAAEMTTLQESFSTLFSSVAQELNKVNTNWSPNLSNNFQGKINSAQQSFSQITQELMNGAKVANTCATTFESVDSALAKLYGGDFSIGTASGTILESRTTDSFMDVVEQSLAGLPEDMQTAGEVLGWIEDQIGKLPDWVTSGVENFWDIFIPADCEQLKNDLETLKEAYGITSDILQGEFNLKSAWDAASKILKKNTKLAVICETINYTFETGLARNEEMEQQMYAQLEEGDILGAVLDGAEGFIDTIGGGVIEVLGDVGGGLLDKTINKVPVVKGLNKLTKYVTGLAGANDGDGYSVGGLLAEGTEYIAKGVDAATDFITDTTDIVTDAITDGAKATINWVKGWFD